MSAGENFPPLPEAPEPFAALAAEAERSGEPDLAKVIRSWPFQPESSRRQRVHDAGEWLRVAAVADESKRIYTRPHPARRES